MIICGRDLSAELLQRLQQQAAGVAQLAQGDLQLLGLLDGREPWSPVKAEDSSEKANIAE